MSMTDTRSAQSGGTSDQALPIGTTLSGDQFTITGHLGAGGFGITYHAMDNVLGRTVVLKECFPIDFCVREGKDVYARTQSYETQIRSIVKMFMREARSLAKLRHPNIVGVHRAFEENGTAYMVLDLIDGLDLFDILDKHPKLLSPGRIKTILQQLLEAIETVHDMGLLHRDISPDNIIIEKDGSPVLIDFGAARADASRHTRAVSSFLVVKDGYSPQEFYVAGSAQSPSADLYALGATFYHLLTGRAPVNSQTRMMDIASNRPDPCEPLEGRIPGYDDDFLRAIDQAMIIHPDERMQSAAKWRTMIANSEVDDSVAPSSKLTASAKEVSLELEVSVSRLVAETNSEVRRISQEPPKDVDVAAPAPAEPVTSKPAWIDEFNQETSDPTATAAPVPEADEDWGIFHDDATEQSTTAAPDQIDGTVPALDADGRQAETSGFGTNWVDRAMEKQERIRQERIAAWEGASLERPKSTPRETEISASLPDYDMPVPEPAPKNHVGRFGLYVGLALCCYVAFTVARNPDTLASFEGFSLSAGSLFGGGETKELPKVRRLQ